MAKFNITEGSVNVLGGVKTGMEVTFIADDGTEAKQYYEVESIDKAEIEATLQKAADEFSEKVSAPQVVAPTLETGVDIEIPEAL